MIITARRNEGRLFVCTGLTIWDLVVSPYSILLVEKFIALSEFITSESKPVISFSHEANNEINSNILKKLYFIFTYERIFS